MNRPQDFPESPWQDSRFVPGEGPHDAKIVILGEAPGKQENAQGRPFVGGSGKILNIILKNAGLSRDDVYVTNVIKYQPPKNRINTKTAQAYVQDNIPALMKELKGLKQKRVIVPTGNTAMAALGLKDKVTRARGFIYPTEYLGKVIPTFHPAHVMRQFSDIHTVTRDFMKIKRHAAGAAIQRPKEVFQIAPTADDVENFAAMVINRLNHGQKLSLSIDLETYITDHPTLTPIKTVGMSLDDSHAIVVPFITQADNMYWRTEDEELRAIKAIGSLLEDPRLEKMAHNALFDILVLMNHGFTIEGPIYDTMLAQYLVYHPSPHTLEYLVSIYTDYDQWKTSAGHNDREFREYNARDVVVLHMCKPGLDEDLDSNNVRGVFEILQKVIKPTCQMMLNGMHIDTNKHQAVREPLEESLEELREKMEILADTPGLNPNSNAQLQEVLFNKLKLRSQVKTKSGKGLSTGDDVLKRLSLRYPDNEFVATLRRYRELHSRHKTFVKNLRIDSDSRVRSSFSLHTVVSGRYSSTNPNLQNLPARTDPEGYIRGMYAAPPGHKIVTADYSQFELVIFAVLSGDPEWLEAMQNGDDVHRVTGKALLGEYQDKYRTFIKNFTYGFIYGSQGGEIEKVAPKELIQQLTVQEMIHNLQLTHPKMFEYRHEVEESIRKKHYVTNAYGRKRWFVGQLSNKNYREAYNHRIQSTAGDIMHTRTAALDEVLDLSRDKLVLQLHDAFYFEVEENRVDTVAQTVKDVMEEKIVTPLGYEFNVKADVEVGDSLAKKDLEKWTNARLAIR